MFTRSDLNRYVTDNDLKRAENLESGDFVKIESVVKARTGGDRITALVNDFEDRETHHLILEFSDADGLINGFSCDCEYNRKTHRLCVHGTALVLRWLSGQNRGERFRSSEVPSEPRHRTDAQLRRYLIGLGRKNFFQPAAPEGDVELRPHFTTDGASGNRHALTVEFRIGRGSHFYVVKSVTSLTDLIQHRERMSYGKYLDFWHSPDAFSEDSRPLVHFLTELRDEMDRMRILTGIRSYQGYMYTHLERQVELSGHLLDRFFEACRDRELLKMRGPGTGNHDPAYTLSGEAAALPLDVQPAPGGYRISLRKTSYLLGRNTLYMIDDESRTIRRCAGSIEKEQQDFLDLLSTRSEGLFIAEEDLPMFCRDVLPEIGGFMEVSTEEFHPERYLPEKPEFEIYLDMDDEGVISCQIDAVYGQEHSRVLDSVDLSEKRDIAAERAVEDRVRRYFSSYHPQKKALTLSGNEDDAVYRLLTDGISEMQEIGPVYISDTLRKLQVRQKPHLQIGVSLESDLLNLGFDSDEMTMEELAEILSRYERKKKYYRLRNGSFVNVEDTGIETLAELTQGLQLSERQLASGNVVLPKYRVMQIENASCDSEEVSVRRDRDFRALVRQMKTSLDGDYEVPSGLEDLMRGYQREGFRWLHMLCDAGFGALLADEMGLGKTLQVLALISSLQDRERTLVVCPASLVYNWKSEIEKFTPEIPAVVIAGSAEERAVRIRTSHPQAILVTSYDTLRRDLEIYEEMSFTCEIIDEAQFIKNASTISARAVKSIRAGFRIALTGTPIENRLSELWSIFDYLMPGFLFSYTKFRAAFELPVMTAGDAAARERLQKMISPFVLRRLKKSVLRDLPDKLEETYYAELEGEQRELYRAHVERLKILLGRESEEEFRKNRLMILSELTRLRQLCCAPELVYTNYRGNSAKEDLCIELIRSAIDGGHKILLFSQFTSMLERLNRRLDEAGIRYHLLTGATSKQERARLVQEFQQDDVPVFCISLKAGGTGLNLTAADIVIHYDPWWNPAVENQASDRAHRIGQNNVVNVYRLIMKSTIEEKIRQLQAAKAELADEVLSGEAMSDTRLTREELMELLQ